MWIRSKKQLYIWFMLLSLLSLSLSYPSHALSLPPPLHLSLPFSLAQSLASHYLAISPPPFQLFSSSVSLSLFPSLPPSLCPPPPLPIPNSSLLPRTPSPLSLPLPPFPPSLHSPRFPPPPFLPPPLPLSPPSCIARTPDLPLNLSFVKHSLYHILLPFLLHHLSSSISIEE